MPASGSPTKPSRGLSAVMRPRAARAVDGVVVAHQPEPVLEALGEALVDHRPVQDVLERVADRRRRRAARRAWRRTRRRRDSCTIAVPSDVQRWPAVPKPPNSAPSTARSTSASSITTIGFLPPSSRHGDWRWRPQSSPIREPTADGPGEADLVDQALLERAPRGPRTCRRPTPARRSARRRARRRRGRARASASPSAALYSAGFHTTALPHRIAGHEVPGRHRDREVARGDDRRHADRHAEGEELLVGHLATARSGRTAAGPRRGRSRTCRRSPGPRRAPPGTACRSRA